MSSSAELRRGHIGRVTEDARKLREIIDAQIDVTKPSMEVIRDLKKY